MENNNENPFPWYKPFFSIWRRTRKTTRKAIDLKVFRYSIILVLAAGIAMFFHIASDEGWGDDLALHWLILLGLTAGPAAYLLWIFFYTWLIKITGKILRGKGTYKELFIAGALGDIPMIWSGLIWVVLIPWLGQHAFISETSRANLSDLNLDKFDPAIPLAIAAIVMVPVLIIGAFTFLIWMIIINCKTIAEAQGFSAWEGLVNHVIAIVLMILASIIFSLIFLSSWFFGNFTP